jgi:hypothetical protein
MARVTRLRKASPRHPSPAKSARAQHAGLPVVGILSTASMDDSASRVAAFRRGLADGGYVEGGNVAINIRGPTVVMTG